MSHRSYGRKWAKGLTKATSMRMFLDEAEEGDVIIGDLGTAVDL